MRNIVRVGFFEEGGHLILLASGVVVYISVCATSIQSAMQIFQMMRQILQDLLTGKVRVNIDIPKKTHA